MHLNDRREWIRKRGNNEVKWTQENKSLVWETRDCTLKQYNRKKKSCIIFGNEKVWGKGFLWCPWLLWLMMKGMREVVFSKFQWRRRRRITDFLFYMHMWDRDQSVQVCVCREDYDERMMIGKRGEKRSKTRDTLHLLTLVFVFIPSDVTGVGITMMIFHHHSRVVCMKLFGWKRCLN